MNRLVASTAPHRPPLRPTRRNPKIRLAATRPPRHLNAPVRAAWRALAPRADAAVAAAGSYVLRCDLLAYELLAMVYARAAPIIAAGGREAARLAAHVNEIGSSFFLSDLFPVKRRCG